MAERRMFALKIVDSDAFLDMPASTQNLYFHLSMRADDDGFISNAKKVMRMIGASDDDMKILLAKRFLLSFDTGIVVIKHWRLHNYIAKDRYTETIYKEEKEKLFVKANGSYTDHSELVSIPYTGCIQNDDTGKVSIGKVSEGENNNIPDDKRFSFNPNDIAGSFEKVRSHWNSKQELPNFSRLFMNLFPKERDSFMVMLSHGVDTLCLAIDHYSILLSDPVKYGFDVKYAYKSLPGFLQKVENYLEEPKARASPEARPVKDFSEYDKLMRG